MKIKFIVSMLIQVLLVAFFIVVLSNLDKVDTSIVDVRTSYEGAVYKEYTVTSEYNGVVHNMRTSQPHHIGESVKLWYREDANKLYDTNDVLGLSMALAVLGMASLVLLNRKWLF